MTRVKLTLTAEEADVVRDAIAVAAADDLSKWSAGAIEALYRVSDQLATARRMATQEASGRPSGHMTTRQFLTLRGLCRKADGELAPNEDVTATPYIRRVLYKRGWVTQEGDITETGRQALS